MKLVIASHPNYKKALNKFLISLDYKNHIDDIIVSLSDVGVEKAANIQNEFKIEFDLKHVLSYPYNIFEYSSFVALGLALEEGRFDDSEMFFMLHDTMEAGPEFWNDLEKVTETCKNVRKNMIYNKDTKEIIFTQGITKHLSYRKNGITSQKEICMNKFKYTNGVFKADTPLVRYFLDANFDVTSLEYKALKLEPDFFENNFEDHNVEWFPLTNNFNIGIIKKDFLKNVVMPKFKHITCMDKREAIDIEINHNNKLNLRNISKHKCCFIDSKNTKINSSWKNDTDVYENDKKRCVAYLPNIDLKKYLYFMLLSDPDVKHIGF